MEAVISAWKLGDLLDGIIERAAWAAAADMDISGVFDDSRRVQPGGLFVAMRGVATDGRQYMDDAIRRGAVVVLGERLERSEQALCIPVADPRTALARVAARFFRVDREAGQSFKLIGVTGTNGKSTTTHMTRAILRAAGKRCGMLGTVQYDLIRRSVTADMTTPGPIELASYLRECVDAGADAAAMEVSSHALDQRRADGLRFDCAGFTNLTQDHLDYHKTIEAYRDAKARLFQLLDESAVAIVNKDDPAHADMIRGCKARVLTFSLRQPADITATITRDAISGTIYRLKIGTYECVLENALVGKHNVYNAMAAAGLAHAAGAPLSAIEPGLSSVRNIPGRLQRVIGPAGVEVFVDYAHTPDAIRNVGSVLRPLTRNRLVVLFGCGGDRDRTKRPLMAQAAAEYGHAVIVTSDNPRTEDPQRIIDEIMTGFDDAAKRRVIVEPDRKQAIYAALSAARDGDVVLIAGKGHESYQIVGREKRHFDDVECVLQAAADISKHSHRAN